MAENQEREVYLMLKNDESSLVGFAGCNTIQGIQWEEGNRISFSNIAITSKACPDVALNESGFLEILRLTNNYMLNGNLLSLKYWKTGSFGSL